MPDTSDRAKDADTESRTPAAERMVQEAYPSSPQATTDLRGNECKIQPGQGEIPTLEAGKQSKGCDYKNQGTVRPGNEQMPPFNTAELYAQATKDTVRVLVTAQDSKRTDTAKGTGVVMGRGENECFIATANHNIAGEKGVKINDPRVVMPNGETYPAEVELNDKKGDRAVLSVKTGADTDSVCMPAGFSSESNYKGYALVTGFPQDSKSLYASPGKSLGLEQGPPGFGPEYMLRAHTKGGNSGGPVRDSQGKVLALLSGGFGDPSKDTTQSAGTPVSENWVSEAMKKIKEKRK